MQSSNSIFCLFKMHFQHILQLFYGSFNEKGSKMKSSLTVPLAVIIIPQPEEDWMCVVLSFMKKTQMIWKFKEQPQHFGFEIVFQSEYQMHKCSSIVYHMRSLLFNSLMQQNESISSFVCRLLEAFSTVCDKIWNESTCTICPLWELNIEHIESMFGNSWIFFVFFFPWYFEMRQSFEYVML